MEKVVDLIRSAGDGAVAIDRLQNIVFWNDACERILGYKAEEVIGKPCYEVIGGTAVDGCVVCCKECVTIQARQRNESMGTRHMVAHDKAGSELWLSVSTIFVPSTWSELSVLFHLIRDITAHKRVESLVQDFTNEVATLPIATELQHSHLDRPEVEITDRERQILQALSTGKTSPEIAGELDISKATVRNHIHNILRKLGVHNRLEAVILSLRAGLL